MVKCLKFPQLYYEKTPCDPDEMVKCLKFTKKQRVEKSYIDNRDIMACTVVQAVV